MCPSAILHKGSTPLYDLVQGVDPSVIWRKQQQPVVATASGSSSSSSSKQQANMLKIGENQKHHHNGLFSAQILMILMIPRFMKVKFTNLSGINQWWQIAMHASSQGDELTKTVKNGQK